jgi:hypothetical protein
MEIVLQAETGFREWIAFLEEEKILNTWGYARNFQSQCGIWTRTADLSFAVCENKRVLAICPLFLNDSRGRVSFADDGGYLRGPIVSSSQDERKRNKILDVVFAQVDASAIQHGAEQAMFYYDPQPTRRFHANPLSEFGFLDTSLSSQLLDLSMSEEDLRADLRKSYKALINKGLKTYEIHAISGESADWDIHEAYRETHKRAAGRETRPRKYFNLQFDELKAGEATLIFMKHEGKLVQLDYFNHRNNYVYYSSAADDPEFSESCEVPLGHAILWFAQAHFKARGMKWMEIGWQFYGHQMFCAPSPKEMAISYFKRGFGGYASSLYRGIKFYSEEARARVLAEETAAYLKACSQAQESNKEQNAE